MPAVIVEHPDVVVLPWQLLATRDAHGLDARVGFTAPDDPDRWVHRRGGR